MKLTKYFIMIVSILKKFGNYPNHRCHYKNDLIFDIINSNIIYGYILQCQWNGNYYLVDCNDRAKFPCLRYFAACEWKDKECMKLLNKFNIDDNIVRVNLMCLEDYFLNLNIDDKIKDYLIYYTHKKLFITNSTKIKKIKKNWYKI